LIFLELKFIVSYANLFCLYLFSCHKVNHTRNHSLNDENLYDVSTLDHSNRIHWQHSGIGVATISGQERGAEHQALNRNIGLPLAKPSDTRHIPTSVAYPNISVGTSRDVMINSPVLSFDFINDVAEHQCHETTIESKGSDGEVSKDSDSGNSGMTPISLSHIEAYDDRQIGLTLGYKNYVLDHSPNRSHPSSKANNIFPQMTQHNFMSSPCYFSTNRNYSSGYYQHTRRSHSKSQYSKMDQEYLSTYETRIEDVTVATNMSIKTVSQQERFVTMRATNIVGDEIPAREYHCNFYHHSNPRYVIRSSQRAFEQLKYLLPCVRSGNDSCPVSISNNLGSIRYHKKIDNDNQVRNIISVILSLCYHLKEFKSLTINYFSTMPL
jgi:hypothetical protein